MSAIARQIGVREFVRQASRPLLVPIKRTKLEFSWTAAGEAIPRG